MKWIKGIKEIIFVKKAIGNHKLADINHHISLKNKELQPLVHWLSTNGEKKLKQTATRVGDGNDN